MLFQGVSDLVSSPILSLSEDDRRVVLSDSDNPLHDTDLLDDILYKSVSRKLHATSVLRSCIIIIIVIAIGIGIAFYVAAKQIVAVLVIWAICVSILFWFLLIFLMF